MVVLVPVLGLARSSMDAGASMIEVVDVDELENIEVN